MASAATTFAINFAGHAQLRSVLLAMAFAALQKTVPIQITNATARLPIATVWARVRPKLVICLQFPRREFDNRGTLVTYIDS